jgi:tetratricopeptide (TPR) repeat protein
MGFFDRLFRKDKANQNNAPIEIPEGELLGFLRYEATFRAQECRFPRFHEKSNPATIGSVLNVVISKLLPHIKSMSCVRTGELGKTLDVRYESDPSNILNTKLFPLIRTRNDKGEYIPLKGENVTFILKFDEKAPAREAIVFLRGTPGQVTGYTYCMRVSVMIPQIREDDNLITGAVSLIGKAKEECNSNPFQISFIIFEDYNDTSALMSEYDKIETPTLAKYRAEEKFTSESEWAIIRGIYEQHINAAYIAWGRGSMENCRWSDGYNLLIRAFRNMATSVLTAQKEQLGVYYEVAHDIGICLEHLERYDEAAYFLWVAHNNDDMGLEDLVRVYAQLGDLTLPQQVKSESFIDTREDARLKLQFTTSEDFSSKITVGYVFNELYGTKPGNLTSMVIIRKGDLESKIFLTDEQEVWNYPMRDLLDDDTKVIVTYSPVCYTPGTIDDKSGLHYESSFIVSINTANEVNGLMRVNVMLPNFPYDDDKAYGNDRNNNPEGVSFIMSKEIMRYNQIGKNLDAILSVSYSLSSEGRIIEALHAARYAYSYVISRWDLLEEDWSGFLAAAAYQIGFCLMDFKLHSKANYYLRSAAASNILKYIIEFINSFANLNDRHVLDIIEAYEKITNEGYDSIEYDNFIKFLKRRKAYVFIEMERYDDAEVLFREMLESNDEESKDFAANELEYLRNLRSQAQNS